MPGLRRWVGAGFLTCCLVIALATGSWAYEPRYDSDLRWDGGGMMGGFLLNPAVTSTAKANSITLSVQRFDEPIWEVQVIQAPLNRVAGGLIIGGAGNTWAYGAAYGGDQFSAGLSIQGTGWDEDEREFSVGTGVLARAGGLSVGAVALFPVDDEEREPEYEVTAGLTTGVLSFAAGRWMDDEEPCSWAGVKVGPLRTVSLGYVAEFDDDREVEATTASLRLGGPRYLVVSRKDHGGDARYSVGLGATF